MAEKGRYTENPPIVMVRNARLSFADLHTAKVAKNTTDPNAVPKYGANALCDDQSSVKITATDGTVLYDGPVQAGMDAHLDRLIKSLWERKPPKMKPITCAGTVSMDTGLGVGSKGEFYGGYEEGMYLVTGKNKTQPTLLTKNKRRLDRVGLKAAGETLPSDGEYKSLIEDTFYPGSRCDMSFELYAAQDANGQAIYSKLRGVKFRADDTRLAGGGGTASEDEFEDDEDADEQDFG